MTCNILIDPLPEVVLVDGEEYAISTSYRTGMLFEMLLNDPSVEDAQKGSIAISLWFPDKIPNDVDEAVDQIIWFYTCGRPPRAETSAKRSDGGGFRRRIYDFEIDAPLIYAAFLQQYGIDMQEIEDMHWWRFSALFSALSEDCEITKIMSYRAVDLASIKNKAERARLSKLQAKHRLPSNLTNEQKVAAAGALFAGMMGGK